MALLAETSEELEQTVRLRPEIRNLKTRTTFWYLTPTVHHQYYRNPPLDTILSQLHPSQYSQPVLMLTFHFFLDLPNGRFRVLHPPEFLYAFLVILPDLDILPIDH
jgi:hypothetical protein